MTKAEMKNNIVSILLLALLALTTVLGIGCGFFWPPWPAFDQSTISQFNNILNETRTEAKAQGMILAVWSPGRGEYMGLSGVDDITTGSPLDPNKLFRIASLSKTFTATAALEMADAGLISLDDKVDKYIAGVPHGDIITLKMLFNHTSGLPNYTASEVFWDDLTANRLRVFTPQDLLNYAFALPLQSEPGAAYHYANTNTILLGLIIEQVNPERETLAQAVKRRVIDQIGLANTSFPTDENFPGSYLHGYQSNTIPGALDDWSIQNPSWMWAAGAVISNIYDLKTYIKALYDNSAHLLSPAMQARRINEDWVSIAPTALPTAKYGLGWAQVGGFFWHDGATYGYHCIAGYDPTTGTTIVAMMNTHPEDMSTCLVTMLRVIRILYPDRPL